MNVELDKYQNIITAEWHDIWFGEVHHIAITLIFIISVILFRN
jgi:hypothetical protein